MGFFDKYFIEPVYVEQGYNFINTITYAVIALGMLYGVFHILKHFKMKIDYRLFVATIPFIFFATTLRAFVDSGLIATSFWTVAPGIYLLATFAFLVTLTFGMFFDRKRWHYLSIVCGLILFVGLVGMFAGSIALENTTLFLGILLTLILLALAFYFIFIKLNWKWISDKYGFSAFFAHLLDATVTSMIIYFVGGWEKHPLPRFFIERFGAFTFLPLKLIVVIPAIYVISTELKDKQLRNFLLIAIAVLGLGEGIRNLISLILI
ncbi:DUF63 family protein [Candidatus Woesearchaeota archaeon]|jgi:uncharacterized membrane protein|nr:DUF63 family protein [Candidatus Woesearchaeota archaeon]MBT4114241.1 DUF63 family protein [Candidatus Woesearchaeota archaeon]MBT4248701.1 DUF63 family protein [Candidatus Woesearchaeota archaeon]